MIFSHNYTHLQDELCCWACSKCEEYEYLPNETVCEDCGEGRMPTLNRKSCYDLAEKELQYMRWDTWFAVIPAFTAAVGILLTLVVLLSSFFWFLNPRLTEIFTNQAVLVLYTKYRQTPVIKASAREVSYILLLGIYLIIIHNIYNSKGQKLRNMYLLLTDNA